MLKRVQPTLLYRVQQQKITNTKINCIDFLPFSIFKHLNRNYVIVSIKHNKFTNNNYYFVKRVYLKFTIKLTIY